MTLPTVDPAGHHTEQTEVRRGLFEYELAGSTTEPGFARVRSWC
ncbi:hypothetical protein Pd630_LPD16156 (plasmid) [Rhodococcus opacus PD630]|nr:hypothetical protein Pd630_LPD16156 [Rhodococcus opacus PD630]